MFSMLLKLIAILVNTRQASSLFVQAPTKFTVRPNAFTVRPNAFTTKYLSRCSSVVLHVSKANRGGLGGGGGAGFGASSRRKSVKEDDRNGNRKVTKVENEDIVIIGNKARSSTGPKLDKWGLPPPTIDDIFPPMPQGTTLIQASSLSSTSRSTTVMDEIQDAFTNKKYCISANYLRTLFDENGVEWLSLLNNSETTTSTTADSTPRNPMKLRLLHHTPPVLTIDNFMTKEECLSIEQVAFRDDTVVSSGRNNRLLRNDNDVIKVTSATFTSENNSNNDHEPITKRTSTSWFCSYKCVPIFLTKVQRILNDIPLGTMEEPQIVQYQIGQEFSWHYDEIPTSQLQNGGQRIATVLVYLNTVPTQNGGGTIFRDLKNHENNMLCVQPKQGTMLLFFPASVDGIPDDRTLHKGEKIIDGHDNNNNSNNESSYDKRIIQMWIHQHSNYTAVLPSKNNKHSDAIEAIQQLRMELGYPIIRQ